MAQEAQRQAALDSVLFVPAGEQWLKEEPHTASATHRLAMTHLLAGPYADFDLSDMEVTRSGPTYTVETLRELQASRPSDTDHLFHPG